MMTANHSLHGSGPWSYLNHQACRQPRDLYVGHPGAIFVDTVIFVVGCVIFGTLLIGCVGLLIVIIRFSVMSGVITRGSKRRIRTPDHLSIKDELGYDAPTELLDFFKKHPAAELYEASVKNRLSGQAMSIGNFIPFTVVDINEWKKLTGCSGIPLAIDCEKGVYHICIDRKSPNYGKVLYDGPGGQRIAADSVADFLAVDEFNQEPNDGEGG